MASFWSDKLVNFMDDITGVGGNGLTPIITESVQEKAIEKGQGYSVKLYQLSLTTGNMDYYLIRTPASDQLITFAFLYAICVDTSAFFSSNLDFNLYEGATVTADGDDVGVIVTNYKRNSMNTPDFIVKHDPTYSATGTLIGHTLTSSDIRTSGITTYQLKPSTEYLIIISTFFIVCGKLKGVTSLVPI